MFDRFECYELCVQSPRDVVGMLRAIAGPGATRLREDFCGTAAVARFWVEREGARAVGVDCDAEVLRKAEELRERGRGRLKTCPTEEEEAEGEGNKAGVGEVGGNAGGEVGGEAGGKAGRGDGSESRPTWELTRGDLVAGEIEEEADVVFVGNFSIGYFLDRRGLVRYLERSRRVLGRSGGVFVCDTYGGASAFSLGSTTRKRVGPGGEFVHYHWSHDAVDPLTGMVENSISFRVEVGGEIVREMPRAFVYRWRLWSIAELREAMMEAGFVRTAVFVDVVGEDAGGRAAEIEAVVDPAELGGDWVVMVAGWVGEKR